MNKIISKLRKHNIKSYYLLIFCITLSVLLVSSFAIMFFSPTVLNILPEGGDSRKQALIIFLMAVIGCVVFTTYASSLFFKNKSYEFGILMALGEKKSELKRLLLNELLLIIPTCLLTGIILSIPTSYSIWKLFQIFIIDTKEMRYQLGIVGFVFSFIFCVLTIICIFISGLRFINRNNVIDIIYENRKVEIVKSVNPYCGVFGWILVVSGLFLGYGVPEILLIGIGYKISSIWNITYLLSLIGVYMIMLNTVVNNKKGKNPKKYYKNIIPINMMRFSGKQTVKNMCITTLLISSGVFAAFYYPGIASSILIDDKNNPIDYSFYYNKTEKQIGKNEIYSLANRNNVSITNYYETEAISLITNSYERDYDKNNMLIEKYIDKGKYEEFFSESDFNKVSNQNIDVTKGEYLKIIVEGETENIWSKWDDLELITHPITGISQNIKFAGTVPFKPFTKDIQGKYIISDEDYAQLLNKLPTENYEKFVLFNVKDPEETYYFAKELKNEIIKRSSDKVAVSTSYDEYEKMLANKKGEKYSYDYKVNLSVDNNQLFNEWKYYPMFKVLDSQDVLKNMAVFIMLFIYIAIICFISTGIVSYIRAITIGLDNRQLFLDIKRLGASNEYIEKIMKKQLAKIFIYPTIIGCTFVYLIFLVVFYGNSGGIISKGEFLSLMLGLLIIFATIVFMFVIYRISFLKVKKIANIN